eukprot:350674-Chlamydomonas_euryale.AAC.5
MHLVSCAPAPSTRRRVAQGVYLRSRCGQRCVCALCGCTQGCVMQGASACELILGSDDWKCPGRSSKRSRNECVGAMSSSTFS